VAAARLTKKLLMRSSWAIKVYFLTANEVSPNGRWIAFVSSEGGALEIYIPPYPNIGNGNWQISIQRGREPIWNHHRLNLQQLSNPKLCLDKQPNHLCPTFKSPK